MVDFHADHDAWLGQVIEDIVDPQRAIIDPHHHLWKNRLGGDYLLPQLRADTNSGHRIDKTVFIECRAFYLREGPEHLLPVGESSAVAEIAKRSQDDPEQATIEGLVAHADLTLAGESPELLIEVLEQHRERSGGLLRGIRHSAARDKRPEDLFIVGSAPPYLHGKESFRKGMRVLAEQGLSYDSWHYHHQNMDFNDLALAVPECPMVIDHFGTPLGIGIYKSCRDEIFQEWKQEIRELAKCENVYAKLGGLAMPDNGYGWHTADRPPTSDELIKAQQRYYMHTIECFGPERCMFESNFPVDRLSVSYHVLWNAFKKMTADFSEDEKQAMFYGTAEKVYKL